MAPGIQELTDVQLIIHLKARYVRFVDTKQWAALEQLLVDDFAFDGTRSSHSASAFVHLVTEQLAEANTVHQLHVPEIYVQSPSIASAVWPFADVIDQRRNGLGLVRHGFGHYHENYVKGEGQWRISTMQITRVRVECDTYLPDRASSSHVCFSQEELLAWLAEQQGK